MNNHTPEEIAARRATFPNCQHCGEKLQFPIGNAYNPLGEVVHFHQDDQGVIGEQCQAQLEFLSAKRKELFAEAKRKRTSPDEQRVREIMAAGRLPRNTKPGLGLLMVNEYNRQPLAQVEEYINSWRAGKPQQTGKGLYIFGNSPGTGKTAAATAATFEIMRDSGPYEAYGWRGVLWDNYPKPSVQFWKLFDLFEEQKLGFDGDSELDVRAIKTCDLLLLDEIGKLPPTSWNLPVLFSWLDVRDSELRPTIYTSNYELEELAEHYISVLGRSYLRDIMALVDRIAGNCEQVEFSGPSWRLG